MKRLALWLTILGPIVFGISYYALMIVRWSPYVWVPFLLASTIAVCVGPVLFAFSAPAEKRKRTANILLGVSLLVIGFSIYCGYNQIPGSEVELMIGVLLFTFTYGALSLKNKYEKWKVYTRSKRDSFLLSLADSLGLGALFLGLCFRLIHWPGANVMAITGAVLLVLGTLAWNQRFKKEVVHRKETEDKLQDSYKQLEEKQKEITDSITYAKRIQQSLLAHDDLLLKGLGEHFVLYLPKDIVSGDFYWATETNDSFYIAVCDSTGHGVPGAFMSLLNTTFLNEAINEKKIAEPNLIFEHVRKQLIANISQQGGQDGMDGIILRRDKSSGTITYCGANNAPVIVRNGQAEECASDKMPVGIGERMDTFSSPRINAVSGDMIYLCTDGYADQFGGERGKKMKRSGLRILLSKYAHLSMAEQHRNFESTFLEWRGSLEQLDDVCIVGIRIP